MADSLKAMPAPRAGALSGDPAPLSPIYYAWLASLNAGLRRVARINSEAADPTTQDIAQGDAALWKNTTSGQLRLWVNDGGTLKSVQLT